jgi:protein-disulfide isomerase
MKRTVENALTIVLATAAVAVAVSTVRVAFFSHQVSRSDSDTPVYIEDAWNDALTIGRPIQGGPSAPVTIAVVTDLECPACAALHVMAKQIVSERPSAVRVIYIHNPLRYHRFARLAARGAECAAQQGAFETWVDVVFAKQDSLGLKSWESFALDAGIPDPERIQACIREDAVFELIEKGIEFAARMEVQGTPTVFVNGWRLHRPPTKSELGALIDRLMTGEVPDTPLSGGP